MSQVEDPFSLASSTDLRRLSGRTTVSSHAAFELFSLFSIAFDSNDLGNDTLLYKRMRVRERRSGARALECETAHKIS